MGTQRGAKDLEAGQVSLLRTDTARRGGQLRSGHFFKQIALGTGIELRYDFDYIVIRLEWGIGLHVPYETKKKGYFNIPHFRDGNALHLAVGYPF